MEEEGGLRSRQAKILDFCNSHGKEIQQTELEPGHWEEGWIEEIHNEYLLIFKSVR